MPKDMGDPELPKELTMEINPSHPTILNLNTLRKADPQSAKELCLILMDQVMQAGQIPFETKSVHQRNQEMVERYMTETLRDNKLAPSEATRRVIEEASY
jgi:hypothetical protein